MPVLRDHPQLSHLAVLVSADARRGGWQVSVVVLDPGLTATGGEVPMDPVVLDGVHEALRQL